MIIGILGTAGVGKTTTSKVFAELLGSETTQIISCTAPIKAMLLSLGLQTDDFSGRSKDRKIGWIGASPRLLTQSLGDWGRSVNQNLWVAILETRMAAATASGAENLVIDDVRLPSEVSAIRRMGGLVIRVTRPTALKGSDDRATDMIDADYTIGNNGDISMLKDSCTEVLDEIASHG